MRKIDIVNSTVTTGTCLCEELQKITRDFEGLKTVCWLTPADLEGREEKSAGQEEEKA